MSLAPEGTNAAGPASNGAMTMPPHHPARWPDDARDGLHASDRPTPPPDPAGADPSWGIPHRGPADVQDLSSLLRRVSPTVWGLVAFLVLSPTVGGFVLFLYVMLS